MVQIQKVMAVFFSPTGTTKKITKTIAQTIADKLQLKCFEYDFTLPKTRQTKMVFEKSDLVIFGVPVYAGRVPNLLLGFTSAIKSNGATAVPLVLYGNRNYDDALIELKDILLDSGLNPIAAAAFIGEHSFSDVLAKGRPDKKDLAIAKSFAFKIAEQLLDEENSTQLSVKGVSKPYRGYYKPQDQDNNFIDIRKVKPLTNEACTNCQICTKVCPMGSINFDNVHEIIGICTKCCACVKKCPVKAKYFSNQDYLYHKQDLENKYTRRAEPELFFS